MQAPGGTGNPKYALVLNPRMLLTRDWDAKLLKQVEPKVAITSFVNTLGQLQYPCVADYDNLGLPLWSSRSFAITDNTLTNAGAAQPMVVSPDLVFGGFRDTICPMLHIGGVPHLSSKNMQLLWTLGLQGTGNSLRLSLQVLGQRKCVGVEGVATTSSASTATSITTTSTAASASASETTDNYVLWKEITAAFACHALLAALYLDEDPTKRKLTEPWVSGLLGLSFMLPAVQKYLRDVSKCRKTTNPKEHDRAESLARQSVVLAAARASNAGNRDVRSKIRQKLRQSLGGTDFDLLVRPGSENWTELLRFAAEYRRDWLIYSVQLFKDEFSFGEWQRDKGLRMEHGQFDSWAAIGVEGGWQLEKQTAYPHQRCLLEKFGTEQAMRRAKAQWMNF